MGSVLDWAVFGFTAVTGYGTCTLGLRPLANLSMAKWSLMMLVYAWNGGLPWCIVTNEEAFG